ncbi:MULTISPECIES: RNA polymerase sigma factor [Streptomyces]|uniref:Sigma-70 family RNA polymerase sigma factor n=1 Tax=Streptomyces plumbiresistens TaxID=511811 RepID=A0ABP7RUL2_9ACTN|nr:RNA polymerase sigma factor [Streptomyces sp. NBC_01373]MCX4699209.1 RNA polymerase sigma factor [Streptomyces sp. NBC_01373]
MRARIRAGDRAAFADLYDEHARAVYNHALRLTGNWSEAEEAMSETFLAAWRTRETVEPEGGSLKPWLLGIATHKAHNANRGLRRRLAFLARSPEPRAVEDFAEETAGRIDDARRLAVVHEALGRLRRQDREVFALCVSAGLDYQQAAEALGIPVGTVRSRLSRARARLARISSGRLDRAKAEPRGPRGEKESEAALAAMFLQEETG